MSNASDDDARLFEEARELNSRLAREQWPEYQGGLVRIEAEFTGRLAVEDLSRRLAEDSFFCAAHWKHSPAIVRSALDRVLEVGPGPYILAFVAAEYWKWAFENSAEDLPSADALVAEAHQQLPQLNSMQRRNAERALNIMVEQSQQKPRPE